MGSTSDSTFRVCDAVYFDDGPSGCIAIFSVKTLIFCVAVSAFRAKLGRFELRAIRILAGDARLGVTSCETLTIAAWLRDSRADAPTLPRIREQTTTPSLSASRTRMPVSLT